jgi:hypothetical protein
LRFQDSTQRRPCLGQAGVQVERLSCAAFPRLDMKRCFTDAVCRIVKTKPETTYDNFAWDFGERFVPGYKRPSTVDFLMNAPFEG